MKRRIFLQKAGLASALLTAGSFPFEAFAKGELTRLCILHTNDVHSRMEPFPQDGSRRAGLGGAARRAQLIKEIRKTEPNVLLLDAGDIFQGTPYFNFFGGELEFKVMSQMKYDAATLGNHDFDAGLEGLHKQMPNAGFSLINCNYDLSDTLMHDQVRPWQIFEKGGVKVGVLGVGIELKGLVPGALYGNTRYLDPIKNANRVAALLKQEMDCDYVICLSHLGYRYKSDKVSDIHLAKASKHIDLILGGHTHTYMEKPHIERNQAGREVIINQASWAGLVLGRIDVFFERNRKDKCITCKNQWVGKDKN